MEPASFALSIYPILGCIKDLGILVSNIKSAPEQVSSLSKDLDALTAVLDLVCDIFENPEAEPGVLEMRQTFEQVLKNCKDTIEALYSALSGISNSRSGGRLLWESIKIQWKLSHISDLRSYLEAQKTTLILTINMANYHNMRTKNPISILNKLMKDLNMYPGGIYSCGQNPSSTGDIYLRQHIDRAYTMIEETIPIRPGSACATRTASTVSSENLDQARENLGSVIEEWRTFVAESDESPPPYPSTNNPLPEHSRPTSQVSNRSGSGVMFSPAPNRRMFTPAAPQGFRPTGVTKKTQIPTSSLHQIASKRIRTEYLQPAPLIVRPSPPRDCPSVASTSSITSDSAFHATPLSSLMSPPSNIYTHMRSQGPGPTRSNAVAEFHPGAGAVVGRQPFNLLQRSRRAAKSGACVTRAKPPKPANPEDH